MPSINQYVAILAERSQRTFDIPFQEEMKVLLQITASKFTKDSLQKKPKDRNLYIQSFVMPLSKVSKIECPITYGCTLRTTDRVPKPIRANGIIFDYVGTPDFEVPFSLGGDWKENFFKHNKYTAGKIRYAYRDGYIFITDEEIEYIGISGVFENPLAIREFKCEDGTSCFGDDEEYPVPGDIMEPVLTNILTTKLGIILPKEKTEIKVDENSH